MYDMTFFTSVNATDDVVVKISNEIHSVNKIVFYINDKTKPFDNSAAIFKSMKIVTRRHQGSS